MILRNGDVYLENCGAKEEYKKVRGEKKIQVFAIIILTWFG